MQFTFMLSLVMISQEMSKIMSKKQSVSSASIPLSISTVNALCELNALGPEKSSALTLASSTLILFQRISVGSSTVVRPRFEN